MPNDEIRPLPWFNLPSVPRNLVYPNHYDSVVSRIIADPSPNIEELRRANDLLRERVRQAMRERIEQQTLASFMGPETATTAQEPPLNSLTTIERLREMLYHQPISPSHIWDDDIRRLRGVTYQQLIFDARERRIDRTLCADMNEPPPVQREFLPRPLFCEGRFQSEILREHGFLTPDEIVENILRTEAFDD